MCSSWCVVLVLSQLFYIHGKGWRDDVSSKQAPSSGRVGTQCWVVLVLSPSFCDILWRKARWREFQTTSLKWMGAWTRGQATETTSSNSASGNQSSVFLQFDFLACTDFTKIPRSNKRCKCLNGCGRGFLFRVSCNHCGRVSKLSGWSKSKSNSKRSPNWQLSQNRKVGGLAERLSLCFMLLLTVELCVARETRELTHEDCCCEQKKTDSRNCCCAAVLIFGIWDLGSAFGFWVPHVAFWIWDAHEHYSWRRNSQNSTLQNCEGHVSLICLFGKLFEMNILSGIFSRSWYGVFTSKSICF